MTKWKKVIALSGIIGIVPVFVYYFLYPHMPDQVPIHYTGGTPDRYVGKSSLELLVLALLGELGLIFMLLLYTVLRRRYQGSFQKNEATAAMTWLIAVPAVTVLFAGIGIYALTEMV
ncbi:DUF1648 domain-containing protein [Paenibacillus sophorae]|uniref:DUF1648 domain-containing protein n=1 Tax=Paenibacillus sophorae TaxID=1333845 RepID=A0ABX8HGI9_9BACL|nr:DUF1648 domain-containing protein [Paenibacillus sophorae]QWU17099.1 DUF1648 domain-containing protein [Paenibacillus sophorae]